MECVGKFSITWLLLNFAMSRVILSSIVFLAVLFQSFTISCRKPRLPRVIFSVPLRIRNIAGCDWFNTVNLVLGDKWITMANFKLGNEMWKVNWSPRHEWGTKKESDSPNRNRSRDFNPEHQAGALSTELRELMESKAISSMQDACHIWTQLNDLAHHDFSSLSG